MMADYFNPYMPLMVFCRYIHILQCVHQFGKVIQCLEGKFLLKSSFDSKIYAAGDNAYSGYYNLY